MSGHRIFKTAFSKVYPMYVQKAERKDRTKKEVDRIITWLTGYTPAALNELAKGRPMERILRSTEKPGKK